MSGASLAQPDITLRLDDDGVIREAALSNGIQEQGLDTWVGRPWLETVADAGGEKIRRMLQDAASSGVSAFRHVVQRFPSGRELPIEYTTIRLAGKNGGLVAIGKSLQAVAELQTRLIAAQQATEREYWKLRDVETRYRLLFDASTEAVLMIGGEDLRIVEANPAAVRALGLAPGWEFPGELPHGEREAFDAMLQRVREQGRAPGIVLHLGANLAPWAVRASLMAAEPGPRFLLHIAPAGGRPAENMAAALPLDELIARLPDGFAVVGPDGTVLRANQAFLDLVQAGADGAVRGQFLGQWLSEPGADAAVLLANVQRHGNVRLFQTTLFGELGLETSVEVSACGSGTGEFRYVAVLVRDVRRHLIDPTAPPLDSVMADVSDNLGRIPLLQAVKTAADTVERHMIRAALERVDGNRTAAAELLGLSRQSLHTKLNRHAAEAGEGESFPARL